MSYITLPDLPSLILLISTIAFYVYYRILLRYWLRAYWSGLVLSHLDILILRRHNVPLEATLSDLVKAKHDGEEAQRMLDVILTSAENGDILTIQEAARRI